MSAALGCTFGDVLNDEKALTCVAYIAKEAAEVIMKKGITSEPIFGFHPTLEKVNFKNEKQLNDLFDNTYRKIWNVHRLLKASMLQDLEKGKETEINYINGKVVYEADKLGIDVPFNKKVVDIVSKIEKKELDCTFDNINLFNIPQL
jgi:2-dehydropantoate 2-reductase